MAYTLTEDLAVDLHDEEIPVSIWTELQDVLGPHRERTGVDLWIPMADTGRTDGGFVIG